MKTVLIIGIDPTLLDFSSPEFAAIPGLSAEKVNAGTQSSLEKIRNAGFDADFHWTDLGETATETVKQKISGKHFDFILIGAGMRTSTQFVSLFEKVMNAVHQYAPDSRICFNTSPMDSLDAVLRNS